MLSRFSHVQLFATHQAPLSMEFSRQEYWDELPCPPPGDLPNPGIKPASLMSPALAPSGKPNHWTSGDKAQWSLWDRKHTELLIWPVWKESSVPLILSAQATMSLCSSLTLSSIPPITGLCTCSSLYLVHFYLSDLASSGFLWVSWLLD